MKTNEWAATVVDESETHHLLNGKSFYSARFLQVLKYHAPGFAPVLDTAGAYHIDELGQPIYGQRYLRTFGFYQARAALQSVDGWFHILTDGTPLYSDRYAWCGNYQAGFCAVRDSVGQYFHLDLDGQRSYQKTFSYAGDFRDAIAVVQDSQGLYSHINEKGDAIHDYQYLDLDVYHKGFARAKDDAGWCHINLSGEPIYSVRYQMVEPFYNGFARVEAHDGALLVIDETGSPIHQLSKPKQTAFQTLSADMVGYWRTQTIKAAASFDLFDYLPATLSELSHKTKLKPELLQRLLRGLEELNLVSYSAHQYDATERGSYLRADNPLSLKGAALYWASEHYLSWTRLPEALKTGESIHKASWQEELFAWFDQDPKRLDAYQKAMNAYAQHDYSGMANLIDLSGDQSVIDAAGGQGFVLKELLRAQTHLQGTLLERSKVAALVEIPDDLVDRMCVSDFDLFQCWNKKTDVIFLTRVLHDWNDEKALVILKHARDALKPGGAIYLVEMLQSPGSASGAMLDLHMLIVSGGKERTWKEYAALANEAGLALSKEVVAVGHNHLLKLMLEESA